MTKMSTTIAGVHFKNPIVMASGTFGFGREYGKLYDVSLLGGISGKGSPSIQKQVILALEYMRQPLVC